MLRHPLMPVARHRSSLVLALVAAAACALAATASSRPRDLSPGPWCGGTLWHLMTLSDPMRNTVDLHGEGTSIADIAKLDSPARTPQTRSTQFQRHVWHMRTIVDRYRIASNGEIVLILYDIDSGMFMDAYLPAAACLGANARDRTGMLAARKELTSRCPTVTWQWQLLGITVEVGGVGFWNPVRTTRGALQTGAELRPVTNLKVVTGCGVGQR